MNSERASCGETGVEGDGPPYPGRARSQILAINVGSSSLKFALLTGEVPPRRLASGRVERIGLPDATWSVTPAGGRPVTRPIAALDLGAAVGALVDWLRSTAALMSLAVVGHRLVHGGPHYSEPVLVTSAVMEDLRDLVPLDPDHLAGELDVIEAFGNLGIAVPHVACFDTAFHHDMPRVARILPVPRRFEAMGVRRYGFHGLSYAFLTEELARVAGEAEAGGRVILAHLGSGASLAAVRGGTCVDTTMGLTPAAGLVMGTRTGDIDPGLVRFLMKSENLTADQFDRLVNRESGLLGVSETSADIRDLLAKEGSDARAAEAIALFCYQAKKWIGAYAAVLGGLDTLVFSGGIGENSPQIRRRICEGLQFLGVSLDQVRNEAGDLLVSADGGQVKVRVLRTDEELMIARVAARFAGIPS